MIANCGRAGLVPITRSKVSPASVVLTDSWGEYVTFSVEGYQHERINHDHEFVNSKVVRSIASRNFESRPKGICASASKSPFLCYFKSAGDVQHRRITNAACYAEKNDASLEPTPRTVPSSFVIAKLLSILDATTGVSEENCEASGNFWIW